MAMTRVNLSSVEEAAIFIADAAGDIHDAIFLVHSQDSFRSGYLRAAKRLHPDAGGDVRQFQKLQQAKRILDKYHRRHDVTMVNKNKDKKTAGHISTSPLPASSGRLEWVEAGSLSANPRNWRVHPEKQKAGDLRIA